MTRKLSATIFSNPVLRAGLRVLALAALVLCAAPAAADVPLKFNYQGNLRQGGFLVNGNRPMVFRVYSSSYAPVALWTSASFNVGISTGVFRVTLEPSGVDWQTGSLWLETEVAGVKLSPREELLSSPYAINALLHSGKKYTTSAAAPAAPNTLGDMWMDSAANVLRIWNGSAWEGISGAAAPTSHAATHSGAGSDAITQLGPVTFSAGITLADGGVAVGPSAYGVVISTNLSIVGALNRDRNLSVGGPGYSVAFASAVHGGYFYGDGSGLTGLNPANLGAGYLSSNRLAPEVLVSSHIADGSLNRLDFGQSGCSDGEVLKWDNAVQQWACSSDASAAEVDPFAIRNQDTLQAGATFYVSSGTVTYFYAGERLEARTSGLTPASFSQLWRRGDGVIVGSMSATGVLMAGSFVGDGSALTNLPSSADNLGNHTATQNLNLAGRDIISVSTISVSSITVASGPGVAVSTHLYVNGKIYGDVSSATGLPAGDNLGSHTATQALVMGANQITGGGAVTMSSFTATGIGLGAAQIQLAQGVQVSSEASAALGGGVRVSTNMYVVGFASATRFYGDGSGLTNLPSSADNLGNHTATQNLNLAGRDIVSVSTISVSSITVASGPGVAVSTHLYVNGKIYGDVSSATGLPAGDNLGSHTATQALVMGANQITGGGAVTMSSFTATGIGLSAAQVRLAQGVQVSSEASAALGGGVRVSTNMYVVGFASATRFYGDGSGLTNLNVAGDNLGDHTAGQDLQLAGYRISGAGSVTASSVTVTGPDFSVGASTLAVRGGFVGVRTAAPQYPLDVLAAGTGDTNYSQIWRDSNGVIRASMTASGKLFADLSVLAGGGDNMGSHTATTDLNMSGLDIINIGSLTGSSATLTGIGLSAAQVKFAQGVEVSSETSAALGGGVRVSTNMYVVGFASATNIYAGKYYGDGSGLTGIVTSGDNLGSHTATQNLNLAGRDIISVSTISVSSITVASGPGVAVSTHLYVNGKIYGDVSSATGLPSADNLGDHTATQALVMGANQITGGGAVTMSSFTATGIGLSAAQIKLAQGVQVSSEASAALGGGVRVSTNMYVVGFASATKFYGDGSALTGIMTDGDDLGSHTATQNLNLAGKDIVSVSTISVSSITVASGPGVAVSTHLYVNGKIYGDVSSATGLPAGDNLGSHTATQNLNLAGRDIVSVSTISVSSITVASGPGVAVSTHLYVNGKIYGDVSGATGLPAGDNLGSHTATQALVMGANQITGGGAVTMSSFTATGIGLSAAQIRLAQGVQVSSEASAALGGGVRVSTNMYVVGFASATRFYGDGSGLTNLNVAGDNLGSHVASQNLNMSGRDIVSVSTISVSSITVASGLGVAVSTNLYVNGKIYGDGSGLSGISGDNLGSHIAAQDLQLAGYRISGAGSVTASSVTVTGPAFSVGSSTFAVLGGFVGVRTAAPQFPLDVAAAGTGDTNYSQIWRDSNGVVRASMTASGKLFADLAALSGAGDNMGNHTASTDLNMSGLSILNAGSVTASSVTLTGIGLSAAQLRLGDSVRISSEASAALGGGVRVSSNVYIVGFSSATKYYGDGSALTGIVTAGDNLGTHVASQNLNMSGKDIVGVSTVSVSSITTASAGVVFSTNVFFANGRVGIGTTSPIGALDVSAGQVFVPAGNTNSPSVVFRTDTNTGFFSAGSDIFGITAGGSGNDYYFSGTRFEPNNGGFSLYSINGSAATPDISFKADQNTGMFRPGADMLGFTTAGAEKLRIDSAGNIGVSTGLPQARFDLRSAGSTQADMAQIWRDSDGVVRSSMSATGVLMASRFIGDGSGLTNLPSSADNLGNHTATQALVMGANQITGGGAVTMSSFTATGIGLAAAQVKLSDGVLVSSEAAASLGGGVRVSTNMYVVGFASATRFYGDGSGLTNLPSSADNLGNHTATQALVMGANQITGGGAVTMSSFTATGIGLSAAQIRLAQGVQVSSETSAALGGGVRVSTNMYVVGFASATRFYGDGSGLTNLPSSADNLGNHTATQALVMGANQITGGGAVTMSSFTATGIGLAAAQVKLSDGVLVSSEAAASLGGGVRVSTNMYVVGFASATKFYGDGSALTNLPSSADNLGNHTATQNLNMGGFDIVGASSITVAASKPGLTVSTSLFVMNGSVGIGTTTPNAMLSIVRNSVVTDNSDMLNIENNSQNAFPYAGVNFNANRADGGSYINFKLNNAGVGQVSYSGGSKVLSVNNQQSGALSLMTANTERLRITAEGNIGLSSATPAYRLVVSSGAGEAGNMLVVSTGTSDVIRMTGAGEIYANKFYGDGSGLTGAGDNLGSHTASQNLNMAGRDIISVSTISVSSITVASGPGVSVSTSLFVSGILTAGGAALSGPDFTVGGSTLAVKGGNLGVRTAAPQYPIDVLAAGSGDASFSQVWRDSGGVIRASMTASGKLFADLSALAGAGDNLGSHSATQDLLMNSNDIYNASTITASGNITAAAYQVRGETVLAYPSSGNSLYVGARTGVLSSGANNLFVGTKAGYINDTGFYNTFLGVSAGSSTVDGFRNTFVGAESGQAHVDGTLNTFIGYRAGGTTVSGERNIIIGNSQNASAPDASDEINIGGVLFGNRAARTIGISTRSPQAALDVVATGTGDGTYVNIWRDSNGVIIASMTAAGRLYANVAGAVGGADNLGSHSAEQNLRLNGFWLSNDGGSEGIAVDNAGNVVSSGAFTAHTQLADAGAATPSLGVIGALVRLGDDPSNARTFPNGIGVKFHDAGAGSASLKWDSVNRRFLFGKSDISAALTLDNEAAPALSVDVLNNRVGISTSVPQARLDIKGEGASHAYITQIWRNSDGDIVSSMSATGVMMASKFVGDGSGLSGISGDNLGNHTAAQNLDLVQNSLLNVASVTIAGRGLRIATDLSSSGSGIFISTAGAIQTTGAGNGTEGGNTRGLGAVDLQTFRSAGEHVAGGPFSVIGGGQNNSASSLAAVVGGGFANTAGNLYATVSGGYANTAGARSAVAGGANNTASGGYAAIPGGSGNLASGNFAFAAGNASSSTANGAFTWADSQGEGVLNNTADRTLFKNRGGFLVTGSTDTQLGGLVNRGVIVTGAGRLGISTASPQAAIDVVADGAGDDTYVHIWRDSSGLAVASMTASGKLFANLTGAPGVSDNLGNHVATSTLQMGIYGVNTSSSVNAGVYQVAGSTVLFVPPGTGNIAAGVLAGSSNTTGSYNTYLGFRAGEANTTSGNNTFLGSRAGIATTSGQNTFVGSYSGFVNTTGTQNTFLGYNTGAANTLGNNNTFLGKGVGRDNTTGSGNIYVGWQTGYENETGSANTIIGLEAGKGLDGNSFSSTTLLGYQAGAALTTGSDNLFLGWRAGSNVTSGSNNIIIGYNQAAPAPDTSNFLNVGGILYANLQAGQVAIGTATPSALLHISSAAAAAESVLVRVSTGTETTQDMLVVKGSGNVGVGVSDPQAKLSVGGVSQIDFDTSQAGKVVLRIAGVAVAELLPD